MNFVLEGLWARNRLTSRPGDGVGVPSERALTMQESKKKPNPIDTHVGSRVRLRRTMLGMSQEKLGEALGITFQQVQKYEKGSNRIGASRLQNISDVLNVPVAYFFEDAPGIIRPFRGRTAGERLRLCRRFSVDGGRTSAQSGLREDRGSEGAKACDRSRAHAGRQPGRPVKIVKFAPFGRFRSIE